MITGPIVFVDVDTQRDFLEPDGALFVPGSGEILENLARLTRHARARGIPVIATACAHTPDEEDPEPFPPHCLVGTRGQERVEATAWPGGAVLHPGERLGSSELPAHVTIQKTRYDVFTRPAADELLALLAGDDPTFVVYGVATDYCVAAVVRGLLARGRRVALVADAVRSVDPEAGPALLDEFARQGVRVVSTDEVVGAAP